MRYFRLIRCGTIPAAAGALLLLTASAHAGQSVAASSMPVLLAKSWGLGYALVFLAILLGLLGVLVPSMRKTLRKKEY